MTDHDRLEEIAEGAGFSAVVCLFLSWVFADEIFIAACAFGTLWFSARAIQIWRLR